MADNVAALDCVLRVLKLAFEVQVPHEFFGVDIVVRKLFEQLQDVLFLHGNCWLIGIVQAIFEYTDAEQLFNLSRGRFPPTSGGLESMFLPKQAMWCRNVEQTTKSRETIWALLLVLRPQLGE
jgi:hypothetical protein